MNFDNTPIQKAIAFIAMLFLICSLFVTVQAQESAGKTIMARGEVNASNEAAGQRALVRRSPVFKVDNVNTGQLSATQLRM